MAGLGKYPITDGLELCFKRLSPVLRLIPRYAERDNWVPVELLAGLRRFSENLNVNFSRMKVLIQNPENLLYLEDLDRWCTDTGKAFDFGNSDNAIQFCVMHSIAPVHVVLQWAGMPYSITIPIAASQSSHPAKTVRSRKHA